jgi:3-methyl-2-oxobutanoate hydroxymethyltransferase
VGHIGVTPQSVHALGGYRTQGRDDETARRLRADADALEDAGAFAIVLELVASRVAQEITAAVEIPTIGIGSGPHCDGQVQVLHDLLGMFPDRRFRHARRYAEVGAVVRDAVAQYAADVRGGRFPEAD